MKRFALIFFILVCACWMFFYFDYRKSPADISGEIRQRSKPTLEKDLSLILERDQKYRRIADSIKIIFGEKSRRADSVYRLVQQADSLNLQRVQRILDSIGWPDHDLMGPNGHNALFLVIQHADLKTQEKYLPVIREATKKDLLPPSCLALLEDRILLRKGMNQIYGSQIGYDDNGKNYYILPLRDPDSVDQRRSRVGLEPLSAYAMGFQIVWNIEKYKKDLPYFEKIEKNREK